MFDLVGLQGKRNPKWFVSHQLRFQDVVTRWNRNHFKITQTVRRGVFDDFQGIGGVVNQHIGKLNWLVSID